MTFMVYKKPTHTRRYLHFTSSASCTQSFRDFGAPFTHKSNLHDRKREKERIIAKLRKNGYTGTFIRWMSCRVLRVQPPHRREASVNGTPCHPTPSLATQPATIGLKKSAQRDVMPYVPGISEQLSRVLGKSGGHGNPQTCIDASPLTAAAERSTF